MTIPPMTIGRVITLLVLIAAFVLWLVGKVPPLEAALIGSLALATLVG